MRERKGPKAIKYSSLVGLVGFLNLRFNSEKPTDRKNVERFLAESWPQDDRQTASTVQGKIIDLMDLALRANSPEGLVWELNNYVADNSESFGPRRSLPPVRAHWYVRPAKDVRFRDSSQAILKMGSSAWIVEPAPLMHGTEGRVWLSIAQCMVNGELGRLRRCLQCRKFFDTDDARRRFCKSQHQRAYDAEAAKARVKALREAAKERAKGVKPSRKRPDELAPLMATESQQFGEFLTLARGHIVPGSELALFIKRRISGEWSTVKKWLAQRETPEFIWANVAEKTKDVFRQRWGLVNKIPC